MIKRDIAVRMPMAVLATLLILACVFLVFLPHSHECVETDCSICSMREILRNMLSWIELTSVVGFISKISVVLLCISACVLSVRDGTPVGRKVKLSD